MEWWFDLLRVVIQYNLQLFLTTQLMKEETFKSQLDPATLQEIKLKRQLIQRIKDNNQEKLLESNKEVAENQPPAHSHPHTSTSTVVDPASESTEPKEAEPNKNPGVSDTDKMVFDKKFKNFLNHRQEYLHKARLRAKSDLIGKKSKKQVLDLGDAEYYNQEEVLSNTGSDYQYQNASDMQAAYEQMTTGKKKKGGHLQIFPGQSFENELRAFQFQALLLESEEEERIVSSISKDRLFNYLFDEPSIMMLYSINPYQLGDQLAQFQTTNKDLLNFSEFSTFLLSDREPTYFQYTRENLAQARQLGRGIKCAPIIAKWIDQTGIFEFLIDTYRSIDIRGDSQVNRSFLAKKLRKEASLKRISETQVIEIVNINKTIPLNRLLYEIEFEVRQNENWSEEEFISFLQNYKRRDTPEKDRLITKLILTGKYDSSYVYVVSQEVLEFFKNVFEKTPKFAEYFVRKEKFLQNVVNDPKYKKIQSMLVRSEANRYVKKQTVEETLVRLHAQADEYLDIEELMDFMTNRGRPKVVEYRVYIQNLMRQLAIIEEEETLRKEKYGDNWDTASSDEEFNQQIRDKQKKRKQEKIKAIRNSNNFDADKKFNVTIPNPFGFDSRDKTKKVSIRERKLKEMLEEKERQLQEEMKPIPIKEVPEYVKENLYDRMLKEQERQRKERLEKFRLEIMAQVKVSDRLMRPKSKEIHCDFGQPQYKFEARVMPWYCEVKLIDRINKKKAERREKILEQIITRNTDYELPDGVQRMIKRQEERQERRAAKARTASTGTIGDCTFMPQISHGVPDFKTIHEHLHFDIENAKNVKEPIKVEPFSFQNRPVKSKTTYQAPRQRPNQARLSKYEKGEPQEDFQNIPKTEKFQALVELRRKQLQEKKKEKSREKQEEVIRRLKKSEFAPYVWSALRRSKVDPSKSRAIIADRIREFKREERKRKEEYQNQMIRILANVVKKPLLMESGVEEKQWDDSKVIQEMNKKPNMKGDVKQIKKHGKNPLNDEDDEEHYLQDGNYYMNSLNPKGKNLKLNLDQRKPAVHMDDMMRRAVVQGEHLGQYPPEDYQAEEGDQQLSDYNYEEHYEGTGNLHTS